MKTKAGKGGYVLIDFGGTELADNISEEYSAGVEVEGIYDVFERNSGKPIIMSNFELDGTHIPYAVVQTLVTKSSDFAGVILKWIDYSSAYDVDFLATFGFKVTSGDKIKWCAKNIYTATPT